MSVQLVSKISNIWSWHTNITDG